MTHPVRRECDRDPIIAATYAELNCESATRVGELARLPAGRHASFVVRRDRVGLENQCRRASAVSCQ